MNDRDIMSATPLFHEDSLYNTIITLIHNNIPLSFFFARMKMYPCHLIL